jgi:hypothetical protein
MCPKKMMSGKLSLGWRTLTKRQEPAIDSFQALIINFGRLWTQHSSIWACLSPWKNESKVSYAIAPPSMVFFLSTVSRREGARNTLLAFATLTRASLRPRGEPTNREEDHAGKEHRPALAGKPMFATLPHAWR